MVSLYLVSFIQSLSRQAFNGGIGQVQMLERSNYMALIGGGIHPRYKQNIVIFELSHCLISSDIISSTFGMRGSGR